MIYPEMKQAEDILAWALDKNPGPWGEHSRTVSRAAYVIAQAAGLDAPKIAVMGLLHDIGRYAGVTDFRHVTEGYRLMMEAGFREVALACLTHSFPLQRIDAYNGVFDVSQEEKDVFASLLKQVEYNDELRLIQLCDALSLPGRITILQIRLMDVALRYGATSQSIPKWQAFMDIKEDFDQKIGHNLYQLFRDEISVGLLS